MSPESIIAIVGSLTALVVALTALAVQLRALRKEIDGRMQELVAATSLAAGKVGELEGRDYVRRALTPPPEQP